MRPASLAVAIAATLAAHPAVAHGIEARPEGDGHVVVRFLDSSGAPLAGAGARVYAPGAPDTPAWTGTADSDGRVAFTADRDGAWRVDLTAPDGHVDRSIVRIASGLPESGGPALPRWLLAASLTGNILAVLLVAAPRLHALSRRRPTATAERTHS